jgi:hypothetical protein
MCLCTPLLLIILFLVLGLSLVDVEVRTTSVVGRHLAGWWPTGIGMILYICKMGRGGETSLLEVEVPGLWFS